MKKNKIFGTFSLFVALIAILTAFGACNDKAPEYPVEPKIEFLSLSKNTFNAQRGNNIPNPADSILVTFSFQDGDGDIGSDEASDYTVGIIDPRFPIDLVNPSRFKIEPFPQNGVGKAITGEMTVKIKGLCCKKGCVDPVQPATEAVPFKLFVRDRAGHKSNEIELPLITIPCPQ
jgi:hypothetical protein